mgnify:CR=1 FL=1
MVEIVLTAQEMALLVMKAKQIVNKPRPVIAVVGFRNMFCDMSFFDELYGIQVFGCQGGQHGFGIFVKQGIMAYTKPQHNDPGGGPGRPGA